MKETPYSRRIDAALTAAGGSMEFYALAVALYPSRESHRYSSNGGPPGCYMTLSAGLRRLGYYVGPWPERIVIKRA